MRNFRFLLPIYILLLLVMFILPHYSAEGYNILINTTSHLGAQNTPYAWIMNITFLLLGISCIVEAWIHLKGYWLNIILLTAFGIGLILVAYYQHAPIIEGIEYSVNEDSLHSIFASLVGFSFTFFAFSTAFILKTTKEKIFALLAGFSAVAFSFLMFNTNYTGIFQRLMFIMSFGWLIYLFETKRKQNLINIKS